MAFAGVSIFWIQPVSGNSLFADILEKRGDGVLSVNYRASSREDLDAEVARLEGLGVDVLQTMSVDTGEGILRVVHMDTARVVQGITQALAVAGQRR